MTWWLEIILLVSSGLIVGFINTLAGSGTIISISLLMFLGLPPNVANGTNRVAVLFQNIVAVRSFKKQKMLDSKKGFLISIPCVIGSIVGALIAVEIDEKMMEKIIGIVILIMASMIFWNPQKWVENDEAKINKKITWFQYLVSFLMGVYGGFIHIGIGIFMLAFNVLWLGYDLVKANALKNLMVLLYVPFGLIIYMLNGLVNYKFGLIHAVGNIIGAYLATKYALKWGINFVKWLLIVIMILASGKFLGLFELIFK